MKVMADNDKAYFARRIPHTCILTDDQKRVRVQTAKHSQNSISKHCYWRGNMGSLFRTSEKNWK